MTFLKAHVRSPIGSYCESFDLNIKDYKAVQTHDDWVVSRLCIDAGDLAWAVVHHTEVIPTMQLLNSRGILNMNMDVKSCSRLQTETQWSMYAEWERWTSKSNKVLVLDCFLQCTLSISKAICEEVQPWW